MEMKSRRKIESLAIITNNPTFSAMLNPKEVIKHILRTGNFRDEEIERLLDLKGELSEEATVAAADVFEKIILGEKPKIYLNATVAFLQSLIDIAKKKELTTAQNAKLSEYIIKVVPIAQENEKRTAYLKARTMMLDAITAPITDETMQKETTNMTPNGLSVNNAPGISSLNIPNPNFDGMNTQQMGQQANAEVNQPIIK